MWHCNVHIHCKLPSSLCEIVVGLMNLSSCTPCTEGYFCLYAGWTNETSLCKPGFYCPKSSTSSRQVQCPPGYYCPAGSPSPKGCPSGTFSNKTELWMESQCTNCTPGYFCDSEGNISWTGKCKAGYYCPEGSTTMEEVDCPIGFHCPEGTVELQRDTNPKDIENSTWMCGNMEFVSSVGNDI